MRKGYVSSVNYYVNIGETVDKAARNAAKFVFNTLKYQTVKYLGLFNACYKYVLAKESNKRVLWFTVGLYFIFNATVPNICKLLKVNWRASATPLKLRPSSM